jgi:hypothetical protein
VDAVLIADVQRRTPRLHKVLASVPELLKARGVCVVVVPDGDGEGGGGASGDQQQQGAQQQEQQEPEGQQQAQLEGQQEGQDQQEGQQGLTASAVQAVLSRAEGLRLVAEERFSFGGGEQGRSGHARALVWQRCT